MPAQLTTASMPARRGFQVCALISRAKSQAIVAGAVALRIAATTSWPAARNPATTRAPMKPFAPVTSTRIVCLEFITAMNCDDAGAQVAHVDFGESGHLHHGFQYRLIRMFADRLGKI